MVRFDRAAPRGHSTSRRRPLCNHGVGPTALVTTAHPLSPFFLLNLAACLPACLPSIPSAPTTSRLGLGSTACKQQYALLAKRSTNRPKNLHWPSLCAIAHHQVVVRIVLLVVCTILHLWPWSRCDGESVGIPRRNVPERLPVRLPRAGTFRHTLHSWVARGCELVYVSVHFTEPWFEPTLSTPRVLPLSLALAS
jgi:hypothetical protein